MSLCNFPFTGAADRAEGAPAVLMLGAATHGSKAERRLIICSQIVDTPLKVKSMSKAKTMRSRSAEHVKLSVIYGGGQLYDILSPSRSSSSAKSTSDW